MSWKMVKINDIKSDKKYALVGGPFGSNLSGKHYVDEGVPVIRGGNLPFGKKFDSQNFVYVSEQKADKLKSNTAHPGDIVFTQRGTLGQVGIIPFGEYDRYIISQSQMKLTVDEAKADSLFVYYYFRTKECVQRIENVALSSGVPHTNLGILQQFKIPLPPLPTQQKIAQILSTYDDLIDNNKQRIQLLEELAEEIYKEWFVRLRFPGWQEATFLDKDGKVVPHGTAEALPEGWEKIKFEKRITLISGYAFKSEEFTQEKNNNLTVRMGNFKVGGGLQFTNNVKYLKTSITPKDKYKLSPGNLLIVLSDVTREGAIIGNVGLLPQDDRNYYLNQRVSKIEIEEQFKLYAYSYFNSIQFKNYCLAHADSATVLNLSNRDLYKHTIIFPNESLILKFNDIILPILKEIQILEKKNLLLQQTRDLLLPRLISGKISVEHLLQDKHTIDKTTEKILDMNE